MKDKLKEFRSHGINGQPLSHRQRWINRPDARRSDVRKDIDAEIDELSAGGMWLPTHHVDPKPEAHELIAAIIVSEATVKLVYDDGAFDIIRTPTVEELLDYAEVAELIEDGAPGVWHNRPSGCMCCICTGDD